MARSILALALVSVASLAVVSTNIGCGESTAHAPATRSVSRTCHGSVTVSKAADLDLLTGCTSIDGDLHIESSELATLAGLERLSSVHYLVISGNTELYSIAGLSGLRTVAGITIHANPRLESVAGLESIHSVEGLVITDSGITSLAGLDNLISVGDLVIVGNDSLKSLAGAPRLTAVENVDVEKNGHLSGFSELARVEVGGESFTNGNGAALAAR